MTIRVTLPSQASQRARAAEIAAPKPGAARRRAGRRGRRGRRAGSVTTTCGLTVRRIGSRPEARRDVGGLRPAHRRAAGARVRVSPGRPVGLRRRTPAWPATFSPPTASSSNRPERLPSACLDDRQRPALGRVGLGAVGVEAGQVVDAPPDPAAACWPRRGGLGQHRVDLGQVHALRRRRRPACSGVATGGEHRHLLGGHVPVGAGRRHRRQMLQRPAGAHQLPGRRPGQPAVPAQPGAPSTSARRARGPGPARRAGRCGPARRRSGSRPGRAPRVRSSTRRAAMVVAGRRRRGRPAPMQLAHDTSHTIRSGVRSLPLDVRPRPVNPQVRSLSTGSAPLLTAPHEQPVDRRPRWA